MTSYTWAAIPRDKNRLIYSLFSGKAFADDSAMKAARALKELSVTTSTENVVHAFRLLLKRGVFTPEEINVFFEKDPGVFLPVVFNATGQSYDWHEGFCDTQERTLFELLVGTL